MQVSLQVSKNEREALLRLKEEYVKLIRCCESEMRRTQGLLRVVEAKLEAIRDA